MLSSWLSSIFLGVDAAGQANGGGPILLVLRADVPIEAVRVRAVEKSLQDSWHLCGIILLISIIVDMFCQDLLSEKDLEATAGEWHSSGSEPPPELCVKCPAGTLPIWSKRFITTPSPANGGVCGVKMTTSALWQNSSGFWRSLQGRCNASFFSAASDKYHIVIHSSIDSHSSFQVSQLSWGWFGLRGLEVHVLTSPIV